ncbi:response regulator [Aquabacter spiritensis]|uniref:Response regulator receiver domain-containing protein n=1 Tax=Aquabacter spiritensis TaxID=933073 RepID=A0A4R3LUU2_9HYPH|nr:response regulator [Aquabacter spiritensis]TCT04294.1 response regulator receiver domain-containing protein [Aquabacter spiritensis]
MTADPTQAERRPCVLLLDADVVVRHVLAEYLRHCGYQVVEAASSDEARAILEHGDPAVDTLLIDMGAPGTLTGFSFAREMRTRFPALDVVLAGTPSKAVNEASDLCEEGPHLARPYEPQLVLDEIKRLAAARTRKA